MRRTVIRHVMVFVAISAIVPLALRRACAEDEKGGAGGAAPARAAWKTSRVVGSPDPPAPFKVVPAFTNLKFDHPLLITRFPGSDRLIVGEQSGRLSSFVDRPDARPDLFFDLPAEIKTVRKLAGAKGVEAVYGLVFHPDFARNRQCFVCYTLQAADPRVRNLPDGTRVSRFKVTDTDPPRIDASSEEILITFLQGGHNGGDLHFGPDGKLYISTGDASDPNPPDQLNTGQDVSDLLSSILRIDVDRKDEGKAYAVPGDNPFVALKGARPEIWAYGFRNPWRMSFDRETGALYVGDVGWDLWESVHRIQKGGNYGWSAMEASQPLKPDKIGPTPILPPLIELSHSIACSITGGLVYHGAKFPELRGAYLFGDWETRRLWAARFEGDRIKEWPEIARPSIRFVAFGENKQGEVYFVDQDGGALYTLERNDATGRNAEFPTKLSETGLFASVAEHKPAAGVAPFAVNSPQWLDGATTERWAAFPGVSSATLYATAKAMPGMVYWHSFRMHFPKDAVLTRTISLAGKRMETQLLHYDGVDWHAYTFAWRDDQSDADLVPADGAEKEIRDGDRKRVWSFQSRIQCMSCHSNQSEYALGFLPEQLNGPGPDGRNQLIELTESGMIRRANVDDRPLPAFDAASAAREPRVVDPHDEGEPLEDRARSYLHANCGHCHSEHGGGSVPLRFKFPTPIAAMNAVGVRPTRGDFGLPDARIVKPSDPYASTLYFRMAKFGRDRMPHIGSEQPDESALRLIARWIAGLDAKGPKEARAEDVATNFASPKAAQILARRLGRGEIGGGERAALLAEAAKLSPGPVRDLFEGYLPSGDRKKLGSNPRPREILALSGDPGRGETLFWSETNRCGTCHRVGDRGAAVGPDLTAISSLRPREAILESLLEPSRRVEPAYAAFAVATTDGAALNGLMIHRDEKGLTLRDAQGKDVVLKADDVEEVRPSRVSLMPDGQLAELTAQEAADLLAYLASLKK